MYINDPSIDILSLKKIFKNYNFYFILRISGIEHIPIVVNNFSIKPLKSRIIYIYIIFKKTKTLYYIKYIFLENIL